MRQDSLICWHRLESGEQSCHDKEQFKLSSQSYWKYINNTKYKIEQIKVTATRDTAKITWSRKTRANFISSPKRQKNGTLPLAVPLEASHWLSQYPTDFGEWNEDTFIPKHSSGGLWKCLSTVREASGVTRYGKLGWHWRPRRVPNQSCYGYHQISHEGDAMEIFVIAPYASGYPIRLLTFIYRSLANSLHLWLADSDFSA